MPVNPEAAAQLVRIVLPIMVLWFGIGILVSVLYHLSLYYLEGEFTEKDELALDLFITAIRIPLYLFAWPVVLVFDRTALNRIRLFWRWLDPKTRASDPEVQECLREREYRRWSRRQYEDGEAADFSREKELQAGAERRRRLRQIEASSPELEQIWLLVGIGLSSAGVEQIVRRYPDALLPEEISGSVRDEIKVRRAWRCLRCREPLAPEEITLPEPFFLQILREGRTVVEGWAYEGEYVQKFPVCPKCGENQPQLQEPLTVFGRAKEVVAAIEAGLSFADSASPYAQPAAEPRWKRPWWARVLGLKARAEIKTVMGILGTVAVVATVVAGIWMVWFLVRWLNSGVGI